MARKFISFLGTGPYTETTYAHNDKNKGNYTSKYIQEALIKTLCKDWQAGDKCVIFLTNEARKKHWYNETDENSRLKCLLDSMGIETLGVSIPTARNEEEIWEMFNIIINKLDENDEIIYDITHSLRYIPTTAAMILDYAKAVKNIKIAGIYYGAWDLGDKSIEPNVTPIFDLTPLSIIQEWSQAVNTFVRYGSTGHLKELSSIALKPSLGSQDWAREANKFITKLDEFSNNIGTCRGMPANGSKLNRRSIQFSIGEVKESLKVFKNTEQVFQLRPIIPLITKIEEKIEGFDEANYLSTCLATVNWCIDNHLIQQAYTILEETIKTYLCEQSGLEITSCENRENIINKALNKRIRELQTGETIKPIAVPKEKQTLDEKIATIANSLDPEFVKLAEKIKDRRNDINHFGFRDATAEYEKLVSDIKIFYEEFINILEKPKEIATQQKKEPLAKRMYLVFSHQLTETQIEDAKKTLGVETFIYMPTNLQQVWSKIDPEVTDIRPLVTKIITWLDNDCNKGDYVLVQGDYGAIYQIVNYCKNRDLKPIYSTTERKAKEVIKDNNTVTLTHEVSHVMFRAY